MRQALPRFGSSAEPAAVARAVGLAPDDLDSVLPPQVVDTGAGHLIVGVRSREALNSAVPDKPALIELTGSVGAEGVYLAWLDTAAPDPLAHSRFFNPGMGLDEDPATGTAAGPLAAQLNRLGLLRPDQELTVHQGEAMGRPSTIHVTVAADQTVTVAGSGTLTIEGQLQAPPI
jgi:PhzF family phenazine biosynthesis protein